jgi:hypothetical protein
MESANEAAVKKPAKKPPKPKTHSLKLLDKGGIKPKQLLNVKHGDLIKISGKKRLCFDIKVIAKKVPCGGGGGPITVHS